MVKLNSQVAARSKNARLDWAYAHAVEGEFDYVDNKGFYPPPVQHFGRDHSYVFSSRIWTQIGGLKKGHRDDPGGQKFRTALSDQIQKLNGVKPRIVKTEDDYIIYYE